MTTSMVPSRNNGWLLSPFSALDAFDDFFTSPVLQATKSLGFQMDVEDAEDKYVVSAHLPGVHKEDVDVELNEGRLTIAVDHHESDEHKGKNWLQKETGEWKATRAIYLKDAAVEGLSAKLADGILTITVPKVAEKANVTKVVID